ncbi:HD domain-containing protein [Cytobacillus suaedae]|nr:HD domain-containing protein [Cytobacillus suaedae]
MTIYQNFIKRTLTNYVFGSFVAVVGVGGIFIFSTLSLLASETFYLIVTLFSSLTIMFIAELSVFRKHTRPIQIAFNRTVPSLDELEKAYIQTHRFPILTLKRIFGPHLFGLTIPAVSITFVLIYFDLLTLPYRYILLAILGGVLVAFMHGLIEYFLTTKAIQPILHHLRNMASTLYNEDISLRGKVLVSIQQKFLFSSLFIGVFPLLLFSLASQIRLQEYEVVQFNDYWNWAIVVLIIAILSAIYGAFLLYKDISQPIEQLQQNMKVIEKGKYTISEDSYSDEFSRVISGFNLMVTGLRDRERMNQQLMNSFYTTFAMTLDARDPYTAGHSIRVAEYSVKIAKEANFSEEEIDLLKKSALLHDIGKIGVRDNVLLKDGRLTDEEFEEIKKHPVIGASILSQIQPIEAIAPLIPGVRHHHERMDGKGYPDKLKGDEIPIFGRIMAVADAFDAMTSDRPYRKGMPVSKALQILEEGKGTQWDPRFIDIFINIMNTELQKNGRATS